MPFLPYREILPERLKAETDHRDSSDNKDLLGVGSWASATQRTSDRHSTHSGSGTTSARKKDKMSASIASWVENSEDDPWSHVSGGRSGKQAGGHGGKSSGA